MAKDRRIDRHAPGYMEEYKRETYAQVNVRIRKDAGILEALELMNRVTGMPKAEYIRDAIEHQLMSDGYMPEK